MHTPRLVAPTISRPMSICPRSPTLCPMANAQEPPRLETLHPQRPSWSRPTRTTRLMANSTTMSTFRQLPHLRFLVNLMVRSLVYMFRPTRRLTLRSATALAQTEVAPLAGWLRLPKAQSRTLTSMAAGLHHPIRISASRTNVPPVEPSTLNHEHQRVLLGNVATSSSLSFLQQFSYPSSPFLSS
jgi:hypothetical protein